MAFTFTQEYSATVSTAERSVAADTTTGVPTSQTDAAQVQVWISIPSIVAGDEFLVKLYEKVTSASSQLVWGEWRLTASVNKAILPTLILHNGWDVTVQKVTGTDQTVHSSIRKVAP